MVHIICILIYIYTYIYTYIYILHVGSGRCTELRLVGLEAAHKALMGAADEGDSADFSLTPR